MTNTANNYLNTPLTKLPCPQCRANGKDTSGDNLRYNSAKDYWKCFACGYFLTTENVVLNRIATQMSKEVEEDNKHFVGDFKDIPERGISKETCEKMGTYVGEIYEKEAYGFQYENFIKVLLKDRPNGKKEMFFKGDTSKGRLYGLNNCGDYSKPLIITEGEFDADSCVEKGFQACSIFRGAGSAKRDVQESLEELLKFSEIIIWFDNDNAGKKALKEVLEILPKNKTSWIDCDEFKDANEALLAGKLEEVIKTCKKSQPPKGIVEVSSLDFNRLKENTVRKLPLTCLPRVNELTRGGIILGTFNMVLAGVGSGKTTLLSHIGLDWFLNIPDIKIASFFYEENEEVIPKRYIALLNRVPVGVLMDNSKALTEQQWKDSEELLKANNRMLFLGEEFNRTSDGLFDALDYIVHRLGCKVILLDHISYIIGRSGVSKHGERRDIDELVYKLQDFCKNTGCTIIAVSHVTQKKEEKGLDEGSIPSVYSGRGSGALAQIPDVVIALARNTKNPRAESILRTFIVKNRWGGRVGETDQLIYNDDTGHFEVN